MFERTRTTFDAPDFLAHAGLGRRVVLLRPGQSIFSQGDRADSIFYLQRGRAKITIVSQTGKEATITLLTAGDFIGEESLASIGALHLTSVEPALLKLLTNSAASQEPRCAAAKALAVARPIPWPAAVRKAVFPVNDGIEPRLSPR